MIIDHFKKPAAIFTTIVISIILVALNFYLPFDHSLNDATLPLAGNLINWFNSNSLINAAFILLLANMIAFLSFVINDKFIILNERSYFPYFFTGTLIVAGPYMQNVSPAHLSFIFVFFALYTILQIEQSDNKSINIINASLLLSLGSFIQFQTILFLPVIWIAASQQNNLNFKTLQASLLGAVIPYVVGVGYLYVFGSTDTILAPISGIFELSGWQVNNIPDGFWLLFAGVTLFVIIGFISFLRYRDRLNMLSRRSMEVFSMFMFLNFLYFIIGILPLQSSLIYGSLSAGIILSGLWIRISKSKRRLLLYSYIFFLLFSFIAKF